MGLDVVFIERENVFEAIGFWKLKYTSGSSYTVCLADKKMAQVVKARVWMAADSNS